MSNKKELEKSLDELESSLVELGQGIEDFLGRTARGIDNALASPDYEHIKEKYPEDYRYIKEIDRSIENNFEYFNSKSGLGNSMRFIGSVISLGGKYKVELEMQRYNSLYDNLYQPRLTHLKTNKGRIDTSLEEIGNKFARIRRVLGDVESVMKKELKSTSDKGERAFLVQEVNVFNKEYDSVLKAGFGGLVGGVTALGAWGLVSILGSASTGTAISSLSGVAATNATLAWFGGGSLASGGAGMLGGMYVLGGIIAAPVLYLSTKKSYKNANDIKSKTINLIDEAIKLPAVISRSSVEMKKLDIYKSEFFPKIDDTLVKLDRELNTYKNATSLWYSIFGGEQNEQQRKSLQEIEKLSFSLITFVKAK